MKYILILILSIGFTPLAGQDPAPEKLALKDVFDLEYVSDPQISPDGSQVIYVRNFSDIMTDRNLSNLWIINSDGSQNRPLTTGKQNDSSPRWSHDGKKIIYKSNKNGSGQIYLMWLDTRQETRLTDLQRGPGTVSWSPDDQYLAFNMFVPARNNSPIELPARPEGAKWNDPPIYIDELEYRADGAGYLKAGYQQIFTLPIEGGTPHQVTRDTVDHGAPVWSKDGKSLYFSANLHPDREFNPFNSEIYQVGILGGEIKTLTSRQGPDNNPAVSPDGNTIAYTGYEDAPKGHIDTKLYLMNTDGSNVRLLTGKLDQAVYDVQWRADGKALYFMYDETGITRVAQITLDGKITVLAENAGGLSLGRPYSGAQYSVSATGKFAFTITSPSYPADLAVGDKNAVKRLTRLNQDLFDYHTLGETEEIWYESSYDQRRIQGWIVKPPDFDPSKKYPLILEIHGGPNTNYGPRFTAEIQLYAAAGYVVLYTNPRGSTSYGQEFQDLIQFNYPGQDYDDLMSGVDAVIAKGYVDPNNLFVTGGSGGGILSAWIIGKTDRFKAAVVAKPVINWYSMVLYSDLPVFSTQKWFKKLPWEDPAEYLDRSPISLVGNVKTPTMVLTGEQDFRTPIPESEQFYMALKLQKVDAAMVRIPNSSHGITAKPSNLVAKVASILYWFDKYKTEAPGNGSTGFKEN